MGGNAQHKGIYETFLSTALVLLSVVAVGADFFIQKSVQKEYNEYGVGGDVLFEIEPNIKPLGVFADPSVFDSDSITDDEWIAQVDYSSSTQRTQEVVVTQSQTVRTPQSFPNEAANAVVKLICEGRFLSWQGSGVSIDPSGVVLTNRHVAGGDDTVCIVGFPNAATGIVEELYWGTPIIDDEDETGHDLALISVEDPVFDQEYRAYGSYDKLLNGTFPFFEESESCFDWYPELGDKVFVLGYPALSGKALTVTDGLISSLYSADGYLITSAKISSGNSGGLAINKDGCFVGVPTAVYGDGVDENYGEIIDYEFVYEFYDAIADDLEEYNALYFE